MATVKPLDSLLVTLPRRLYVLIQCLKIIEVVKLDWVLYGGWKFEVGVSLHCRSGSAESQTQCGWQ